MAIYIARAGVARVSFRGPDGGHPYVVFVRAWAVAISLLCISCNASHPVSTPPSATPKSSPPAASDTAARGAVSSFLRSFMGADGRVVRRDQGGDTVSEGQAYAMLLAVATGDADAFGRAWGWARAHLQRSDGLLSWHWVDGRVADPQSAGDADVIAGWALTLAAQRFHTPAYQTVASTIARSVLSEETVAYEGARLLVAGPWARTNPAWVNPSYFTPAAFAALGSDELQDGSTRALHLLTARAPHLPPDWARLSGPTLQGSSSPDGQPQRFGYDAVRVPMWMSVSCRAGDRAVASVMWPSLNKPDETRPEFLVAAAAAARAAGHARDVPALLDKARRMNDAQPRYYASALIALGRVLLTTNLLHAC